VETAAFLENKWVKRRFSGKYSRKKQNFWKIYLEKYEFLENKCGKGRISGK
jgi:hypothetical protein